MKKKQDLSQKKLLKFTCVFWISCLAFLGSNNVVYAESNLALLNKVLNNYSTTEETDLELSISTPNKNPDIYSRIPVTITVKNTSNVTATGIKINLSACPLNYDGELPDNFNSNTRLVFAGTNITASIGEYKFYRRYWTIDSLPGGESGILIVNLFTLSNEKSVVTTSIMEASPTDIDSSPNQGRARCEAIEDDEALLILNGEDSVPSIACDCSATTDPVCGTDGVQYNNACEAECAGVAYSTGTCESISGTLTDLELSISTPDKNPDIYSRIPVTITVKNTSNVTATNIRINLSACPLSYDGELPDNFNSNTRLVFASTNITTSIGEYKFYKRYWTIDKLEGGKSGTLTVNLFTLSNEKSVVTTSIMEASPADIDSSPNQGRIRCEAAEDDEVLLILNGGDPVSPIGCDCPATSNLVCGVNGVQYNNACEAECAGVNYTNGECTTPNDAVTCGDIGITTIDGDMKITGKQGEKYFFKVHRRVPSWEYVFQCNAQCSSTQTVTGLSDGTYYVDVYNKSWRLICDDIEVSIGSGLQRNESAKISASSIVTTSSANQIYESIQVYPNPATNSVNLKISENIKAGSQVQVTDSFGYLVASFLVTSTNTMSVEQFANGIYQISIVSEGQLLGQQRLIVLK